MDIDSWLKSGLYLPPALRDFHDQKDTFKALHDIIDSPAMDGISWRDGHIYVIDAFLWFMARRGYTLQRSRVKLPFRDLESDRQAAKEARDRASSQVLGLTPLPRPIPKDTP